MNTVNIEDRRGMYSLRLVLLKRNGGLGVKTVRRIWRTRLHSGRDPWNNVN